MEFTTILTHREASTLYVQINRQDTCNKLSSSCMQELRTLFEQMCSQLPKTFDTLSMGMSHDFETAVEEGATIVRIGSAIFGARPPKTAVKEEANK